MDVVCEAITAAIQAANQLLQDLLLSNARPGSSGSQSSVEHVSEGLVGLISLLSRLSIQAAKARAKSDVRETKMVKCMQELQALVRLQQDELKRSRTKPLVASVGVGTDFEAREESALKLELRDLQNSHLELQRTAAALKIRVKDAEASNNVLSSRLEKSTLLLQAQQALLEHRAEIADRSHDEEAEGDHRRRNGRTHLPPMSKFKATRGIDRDDSDQDDADQGDAPLEWTAEDVGEKEGAQPSSVAAPEVVEQTRLHDQPGRGDWLVDHAYGIAEERSGGPAGRSSRYADSHGDSSAELDDDVQSVSAISSPGNSIEDLPPSLSHALSLGEERGADTSFELVKGYYDVGGLF